MRLGAAFLWISTASEVTGYTEITAQLVVLDTGMGTDQRGDTEAIWASPLRPRPAAVNDVTRLPGGTLGVGVVGSVYATRYSHRISTAFGAHGRWGRSPVHSGGPANTRSVRRPAA
ncbi:hypothetical protein C3Y87_13595 [Carbonactinospora thermoautotrophica]|nr:hypothetical protein [Carbonactinospora thermoautotrophica]